MSLIESLDFKANGIFGIIYFYIEMLSRFYTSFFSKTYLPDNVGPRPLCLFELKDNDEAF